VIVMISKSMKKYKNTKIKPTILLFSTSLYVKGQKRLIKQ